MNDKNVKAWRLASIILWGVILAITATVGIAAMIEMRLHVYLLAFSITVTIVMGFTTALIFLAVIVSLRSLHVPASKEEEKRRTAHESAR